MILHQLVVSMGTSSRPNMRAQLHLNITIQKIKILTSRFKLFAMFSLVNPIVNLSKILWFLVNVWDAGTEQVDQR